MTNHGAATIQLLRDSDGRLTGARKNGRELRLRRDESGRAVAIEEVGPADTVKAMLDQLSTGDAANTEQLVSMIDRIRDADLQSTIGAIEAAEAEGQ